jgi:hypothetical protein
MDTPEIESFIVESVDPEGPYGAKEAGEGPLHPSIPAIANAIYDALGVRCDRLPFSPPRVWKLLCATDARQQRERAREQVRGAAVPVTAGAAPVPARTDGARRATPDPAPPRR